MKRDPTHMLLRNSAKPIFDTDADKEMPHKQHGAQDRGRVACLTATGLLLGATG